MNINDLLILAPSILLALTFHEFAHALTAHYLGDPTPREQGRLTLNPLAHLDVFGTIMLFIAHFGWAKPVIVNPMNFRNPKRDMLIVALAGPFSNLLQAWLFGFILRISQHSLMQNEAMGPIILKILFMAVLINISLAMFNLLPIPPLDGSRIIHALVPYRYELHYRKFERIGMFALLALIIISHVTNFSIIGSILSPAVGLFLKIFIGI